MVEQVEPPRFGPGAVEKEGGDHLIRALVGEGQGHLRVLHQGDLSVDDNHGVLRRRISLVDPILDDDTQRHTG